MWHAIFRIIYFLLGVCALVFSILQLNNFYLNYTKAREVTNAIDEFFPGSSRYTEEIARYAYMSAAVAGALSFFLSLTLFLLARYCRKIIRRNMYIIETENLWNDIKNTPEEKQAGN